MGNEVKEVGKGREEGGGGVGRRGQFWSKKGDEKSLGKGRGCLFRSSPKWLK